MILKKNEIDKTVDIINNIKVLRSDCTVYDIEGESPTAWVQIYSNGGEVATINIYYDILVFIFE